MTEMQAAVGVEILHGEGRDSTWAPIPARLTYSTADPLAVMLTFGQQTSMDVDWHFAFDLLHQVSVGWSNIGIGDVRFSSDPLSDEYILLRLKSPDGEALFRIALRDIKKFVLATKPLMDAEPEVDAVKCAVDELISAILGGSDQGNPVD